MIAGNLGVTHPVDGIRMILTPDDHEPGLHMEEGIIHPVHGMRRLILTHAEDDHDPGLHMEEEITRPAEDDQDPGLHMEEEINFWHPRKEKIDLGCDLLCEKYLH
ncbi:hypothetical protein Scep_006203 [Stephania cephalantha]|uniref:Uncharacterized protein n=1 Tax=Stephania cephalantha TaxID=152367 RepID=A0AAP0PNS5_9MAGN